MYLSRLKFDPLSRQVQKELSNRYELHRTLCAQFSSLKREDIGLLFRVEDSDSYLMEPITLLIQTEVMPDWKMLQEKNLLVSIAEVKPYEPVFRDGEKYHFRLLANPTLRKIEGVFAGKRVGVLRETDQSAWFMRKALIGGFNPLHLDVAEKGNLNGKKNQDGKVMTLTQVAVLFTGILQVNDSEKFLHTISSGVGSAKAFGFGLLSLARA